MNRINSYIVTTLLKSIGLVLLFLIGLSIFIAFVGESREIGRGDYDIFAAIRYVFLGLPNRIYYLFPSAGLVGALLGLGILAHHHELMAIRAAGISVWQICKIVLRIALILTLFVTLFSEWVSPPAIHLAQLQKTLAKSSGQALATEQGLWIREKNYFIHIKSVLTNQHLQGVTIYQFDPSFRLEEVSFAQDAYYQKDYWILKNLQRSRLLPNEVQFLQREQEAWHIALDPTILTVATVEPREMSLPALYFYLDYLQKNHLNNNFYQYAFYSRLFQPLTTLVMILLSLVFIFGPLREISLGLRMTAGVGIGFAFYLMNSFLGPFSAVYQVSPLWVSVLPIILFAGLGMFLLRNR